MQSDCQVTTSELDQLTPSTSFAYRHDRGRMATLAHNGWIRVFAPGEAEQQWDLLAQIQVDTGRLLQVYASQAFRGPRPWESCIRMITCGCFHSVPVCLPSHLHMLQGVLLVHGRAHAK
jgi:hypothetical protein